MLTKIANAPGTTLQSPKFIWPGIGLLLALAGLLIWWGPDEQTLGQGIKIVYLHVGLIWAGLFGFVLAALVGLVVLVSGRSAGRGWLQTMGWVALGFYAAGVAASMLASKINWGAVFLQEPRMAAAVNGLAVAIILLIVADWTPWLRLRGALAIVLVGVLLWLNQRAALVLHPPNPIQASSSLGIRFTFVAVTAVFVLVGAWLTWYWQRRRVGKAP